MMRSLRREAADRIPAGDPAFVGATALPALFAHQERHKAWMTSRADRFSQLLGRSVESQFVGDRLQSRSALSVEERAEVFAAAAEASGAMESERRDLLTALRAALNGLDPVAVLCQLSYRHAFGAWGEYHEPTSEASEVAVEIVAGLLLTQPAQAAQTEPSPEQLEQINDMALELPQLLLHYGLARAIVDRDDEHVTYLARTQWMNTRGDSCFHHARDLALEVFSPLEHQMLRVFGFSIEDFFAVSDAALSLLESRVHDLFASQSSRIEAIIDSDAPPSQATAREVVAAAKGIYQGLPPVLTFTAAELATVSTVAADRVAAYVSHLATEVGSLEEAAYGGPFDPSPLFSKPFVQHGSRLCLPVPGHLLRAPHTLFEADLLRASKSFSKHRAKALDRVGVQLLTSALTGSRSGISLYYSFDDGDGIQRYEVDGLVLFEGYLLIIEGKGGGLSVAAHRGDLTRLGADLKRHIAEAWHQCARFGRYLDSTAEAVLADARGDERIRFDTASVKDRFFVNPLLHSLGAYAFQLPALRELGLFPAEAEPWPILVADLRVITEVVRTPGELLHYLQWRRTLPIGERMHVVDELDVFGAYLFGEVGREALALDEYRVFGSATTDFDSYYAAEMGTGPPQPRPRRVLGPLLERALDDLSQTRPRGWLDQCFAILDMPVREAAAATAFLETLRPQRLGDRLWVGEVFGGSSVVVLQRDTDPVAVALEVAAELPPARRRVTGRVTTDGIELVRVDRLRTRANPVV